ncbi:2340_t:CDS:10, partial [Funneliformis geosporum]
LISYLNLLEKLSYRGFLVRCRDVIATSSVTSDWKTLDNFWSGRFLNEAKRLLKQSDFNDLNNKGGQLTVERVFDSGEVLSCLLSILKVLSNNKAFGKMDRAVLEGAESGTQRQRESTNTTTTKSSTARTPDLVEDVKFHQFDVRQALSVNLYGNLNSITRDKLMLVVEVKTAWVLKLEVDKSLNEKYEDDLERQNNETIPPNCGEISVVDIIRQIFGPKGEPRALEISPTIDVSSGNPSIFKCYAYIFELSRIDTAYSSPGTTPPSPPSSSYDDAGVYDIPEITPTLLNELLKEPEVHIEYGTSNFGLPTDQLSKDKGLVWGARKIAGVFGGTVGVIAYHFQDRNESLVFMWSVPLNYVFYSNWWNIKVYNGHVKANQELFEKIYNDLPHEGDGKMYRGILSTDLLFKGTMKKSGITTIVIEVQNYSSTPPVREINRN